MAQTKRIGQETETLFIPDFFSYLCPSVSSVDDSLTEGSAMGSIWFVASLVVLNAPEPIAVSVPGRTEPVSYAREVADIFDAKCVGCHSGALAENKLILED